MDTIHTIGRRKASIARVYMSKGKGNITVNGKDFKEYFPVDTMQYKLEQPFKTTNYAVGVAGQGMAVGDFFLIENKTITGFNVTFKNSSNSAISKTFDYIAKGF